MYHGAAGMSRRGDEPPRGRLTARLAWLPIPCFVLLFILLRHAGPGVRLDPRLLLPTLNITFITGVSLAVTWLAARSYLATGSTTVLAVASGSLGLGLATLAASAGALLSFRADFVVALQDVGALIAGGCYLLSAILTARPDWSQPNWSRPSNLATGLSLVAGVVAALAAFKASGVPGLTFLAPGGPTVLRQAVLGVAICTFACAGTLFWALLAGTPSRFVAWYSLALLLMAVGLSGVYLRAIPGSATNWAGLAAQYLGGIYLLVAVRTGGTGVFPLVQLLHETQDRYKRLVELSPDAILVHMDGRYVFANPAAVALFGARRPEDIVGRAVLDLVPPDSREPVSEMAITSTDPVAPLREHRGLRLDGACIDLETTAALVEFRGRPAVQVVMRDITERKRAEEKIREARLEAEQRAAEAAEGKRILNEQAAKLAEANRMKEEFLATLSHELRTPLTAILGWAHMLMRGVQDQAMLSRAVEAIHRNAQVQITLINDVLDVSRIVSGKLQLETARVDLATCLENTLASVRPAAGAKRVELVTHVPDGLVVLGDSNRLQQVFWNLLSNAVKFSQTGGRVSVTVEPDGDELRVRVEDRGVGIAPEFLPRVFERFTQADGTTTRVHGGLGIGLAIVRHLVELHGGRVQAESEGLGKGAAFTVWLPAAAPARPGVWFERSDASHGGEHQAAANLSGVRVLVVDDEADARDLLQTMLGSHGAEVRTAEGVEEALAVVDDWRPHVLVSDIGMPVQDGYDLLRRLRQRPADQGGTTPAIAVTAYGREQDRERALAAGYRDHIAKPVTPVGLAAAVAAALGRGNGTAGPSGPAA